MEDFGGEKAKPDIRDRLNELYLLIILRYRDYIESKENLSVAELPRLITPYNPSVSNLSENIKGKKYVYESDFYDASISALKFVKEEIEDVLIPIQFWLFPEECIRLRIGDLMDKCILLCSLLVNLGNPSAKVLILISDNSKKAYVYYEFRDKLYLISLDEEIRIFNNREDMLDSIKIGDDITAYEFNDKMFIDIY